MNTLVNFVIPIAIAYTIIVLIIIATKYVIFIGAILSKNYQNVKINIIPELITLFIFIVAICYMLLNY